MAYQTHAALIRMAMPIPLLLSVSSLKDSSSEVSNETTDKTLFNEEDKVEYKRPSAPLKEKVFTPRGYGTYELLATLILANNSANDLWLVRSAQQRCLNGPLR